MYNQAKYVVNWQIADGLRPEEQSSVVDPLSRRLKMDPTLIVLNALRQPALNNSTRKLRRSDVINRLINSTAESTDKPDSGLDRGSHRWTGIPDPQTQHSLKEDVGHHTATGKPSKMTEENYANRPTGDSDNEKTDIKSRVYNAGKSSAEPQGLIGSPYASIGSSNGSKLNRPRSALSQFHVKLILSSARKPSLNVWPPNLPLGQAKMAVGKRTKSKYQIKLWSVWIPSFRVHRDAQSRQVPTGLPGDRTTKSHVKLSSTRRPSLRAWRPTFSTPIIPPVVLVKPAHRRMRAVYRVHKQPGILQNVDKRLHNDEKDNENDESLFGLSRRRHRRKNGARKLLSNVWRAKHKSSTGLPGDRTTKSNDKLASARRPSLRAWWPTFSTANHKSRIIPPVVLVKPARRRMHAVYRVQKQPSLPQNVDKRLDNNEKDNENDVSLFGLLRRRHRRSATDKMEATGLAAQSRTRTWQASSRHSRDFDDDDDDDDDGWLFIHKFCYS